VIAAPITSHHHRPHSGLDDRTPADEVAQTWDDALGNNKPTPPDLSTPPGSRPAALIDRLIHHAHMVTLKGKSYRLRQRTSGHPRPQTA
jgi:hypothetical protein